MRYGLSEETIEKIRSVLIKHPAIDKAVLYGSRAKGNFKPGSDIDLSLHGAGITTKELGDIAFELDDLLLPYSIDLLVFDVLEHAKLREHIDRVGVVFYQRASADEGNAATLKAG
jgi:predicted nucleotidyltransferase